MIVGFLDLLGVSPLLYIEYSESFRKPFSDVFDVDSNKISSYENGG